MQILYFSTCVTRAILLQNVPLYSRTCANVINGLVINSLLILKTNRIDEISQIFNPAEEEEVALSVDLNQHTNQQIVEKRTVLHQLLAT